MCRQCQNECIIERQGTVYVTCGTCLGGGWRKEHGPCFDCDSTGLVAEEGLFIDACPLCAERAEVEFQAGPVRRVVNA